MAKGPIFTWEFWPGGNSGTEADPKFGDTWQGCGPQVGNVWVGSDSPSGKTGLFLGVQPAFVPGQSYPEPVRFPMDQLDEAKVFAEKQGAKRLRLEHEYTARILAAYPEDVEELTA